MIQRVIGSSAVVAGNAITGAGCWAHFRRKVIEGEKAAPGIALEPVELVRARYAVEHHAKELSSMDRLQLRQTHSAPLLSQFWEKLRVLSESSRSNRAPALYSGGPEICKGWAGQKPSARTPLN